MYRKCKGFGVSMERTGGKKIGNYILLWLALLVISSAGIVVTAYLKNQSEWERIAILANENPKLQGELVSRQKEKGENGGKDRRAIKELQEKYGYSMTDGVFSEELLPVWTFIFTGITFLMAVIYLYQRKREVSRKCYPVLLAEELEGFKRGEFEKHPLAFADKEPMPEPWPDICESLKELGSYFADLKQGYEREENDTKTLITDISHQLKTPLASLKVSHELVMQGALGEEERERFLEQERVEIQKIELLLNELVKLSRLEHHMITLSPKEQDIKTTIAQAVSLVYGRAKAKHILIEMEEGENPVVCHDRNWTAQALSNVLDNAVKYSEEYTSVFIRAKILTTNLLIEIEDNGMGIASEELSHIFKRFYRGRDAAEKTGEGVGVGLYLARLIIEEQKGTIMAKRKEEGGTVFLITLPLSGR